ncbi:MAG: HIT domain-containing protein [Hydrotalea sp.]|nr:HIT domain-containing protein [Hydrotalea sp.]
MTNYDNNNIFAKILRGEIPCKKFADNAVALAFHDIHPRKKIHLLVIPKGDYVSFSDFTRHATPDEQVGFWALVEKITADSGVDKTGYRIITNHGAHGHQEVPHFHIHLLGGESTGPLTN